MLESRELALKLFLCEETLYDISFFLLLPSYNNIRTLMVSGPGDLLLRRKAVQLGEKPIRIYMLGNTTCGTSVLDW